MGLLPSRAIVTGSIKLAGKELVGIKPKEWRDVRGDEIAMIFQDPLSALNPTHKIGRQITEMLNAHQDLTRAQAEKRAIELLGLVGIPQPATRAEQYPHEFSGGMRQRVMIAIAIANNPKILIADEPTTALDTTVQAQILEVIQKVQSELHTAVAFITHDLGVVARIADRVQVMYAGRIAERGDVHDIFLRPTHPYTSGLLSSLPAVAQDRLKPIPGSPPNMIEPPPGCPFAPRCSHAASICVQALPPLVPYGVVETACVRVDEIAAEVKA
jgi:oligopeptide/dipeptide ABC transporter ATP-binding protein